MFERYTERARRVIFFARYEASQFGASAIEPEHILLGLLREDKGLAIKFFPEPDDLLESIRRELEERLGLKPKIPTSTDLPLSVDAKRALGFASEESDRLQHRYVGTEHLLLGLLRVDRSAAAEILRVRGVRAERVREEIDRAVLAQAAALDRVGAIAGSYRIEAPGGSDLVDLTLLKSAFGHYTDAARQAVFLARWEAGEVGASNVTPEHLLLGLGRVDDAPAIASFERIRESYSTLQNEYREASQSKSVPLLARIRLASATLRALADAQAECERLGHAQVGAEHLLVGLMLGTDSRAAEIIASLGVTLDQVRREIEGGGGGRDE